MRTKTCSSCNTTKPIENFPSSGKLKSGNKSYKPQCKPCFVQKQREHYYALWLKYFDPKCSRCGYDKSIAALELHHEHDKNHTPAQRWSISEKNFAQEAKKCIVLCANCHREVHEKLRGHS